MIRLNQEFGPPEPDRIKRIEDLTKSLQRNIDKWDADKRRLEDLQRKMLEGARFTELAESEKAASFMKQFYDYSDEFISSLEKFISYLEKTVDEFKELRANQEFILDFEQNIIKYKDLKTQKVGEVEEVRKILKKLGGENKQ